MPGMYPDRCNGKRRGQQRPRLTLPGSGCPAEGIVSMRGLVDRMAYVATIAAAALLLSAAVAVAHVERTSYWPNPKPDASVKPAAGGKVPKLRSLASALQSKPVGRTRIVCLKTSLKKAKRDI